MIRSSLILILSLTLGCQGTPFAPSQSERPSIESKVQIHRSVDGEQVDLDTMISHLSRQQVVFLGETHLDEITHRMEVEILEGLRRSGRDVVVSLEMFARDRQQVVDDYLAGRIDEDQFLENSDPWNNYETGYRPIVEWARTHEVPVIAANVPSSVWRKSAFGGGLEALTPEQRATIADQLYPNSERYWQRYDRTVRGHGHSPAGKGPEDRLEMVQSLWDNTMGESVSKALEAHPDAVVVHINGGFHTFEGDGTAHQFQVRQPDADFATVHMVPTHSDAARSIEAGDPSGDWIVTAQAVARGLHAGGLAVFTPRPLRYRIDAPPRSGGAAPLLIWLPDSTSDPQEELSRLREAVGDRPCIVVVEPIYSSGSGGDWIAEDHRDEDVATVATGLHRLRHLLVRQRHVQEDRIVLAGEGSASDLIASAVIGDEEWSRVIISTSSAPGWFAMEGLPDPGKLSHPGPGLRVLVTEENAEAWQREASTRSTGGAPMTVEVVTEVRKALLDRIGAALQR